MDPEALMISGGGKHHGSTSDEGEANELRSCCTTSPAASGHCYPGITLSQFFFPFFRLRSNDDNNCYIVECSQDAIQRERQATQEMLSEQLAERDRLTEERSQRGLEGGEEGRTNG